MKNFSIRTNRQKKSPLKRRPARKYSFSKHLRCEVLERRELMDAAGFASVAGSDFDIQTAMAILPAPPNDPRPSLEAAAIHGNVWADIDGNGRRGADEPGLAGVTVYSDMNSNGWHDPFEPYTVTRADDPATDFDEQGQYQLGSLAPGYHLVRQIAPDGSEQTFPKLPDGYIPPPWGDGNAHLVLAGAGQTVDGIDFGNRRLQPGGVAGIVWEDRNGNGQRDANEPGMASVTIYSDRNFNGQFDPDEPHAETQADDPATDFDEGGRYVLAELAAGHHSIREIVPDGFSQTYPVLYYPLPFATDALAEPGTSQRLVGIDGGIIPPYWYGQGSHEVIIGSGQTIEGLDFGNQRIEPGSIAGVVWDDANGNGQRDPQEQGMPGVIVYADKNFNGAFDEDEPHAVTSADIPETDFDEGGRYQLANLQPGFYWIREVTPTGYQQTFPFGPWPWPLPGDPSRGVATGVDGATGIAGGVDLAYLSFFPWGSGAHPVFLGSGQSIEGIDFGNQRIAYGSIAGVKWLDADGDGQRDGGEAGLADVTIYLDTNENGVLDPDEHHTVTQRDDPATDFDEGGRYAFGNLPAGTYVVREVVPDGYRQTFPRVFPIDPGPLEPWPLPTLSGNGQIPGDGVINGGASGGVISAIGDGDDGFATIRPQQIVVTTPPGAPFLTEVAITIHPQIFRAIEIDLQSSSAEVEFVNLSGVQVNGGGGDTSLFHVLIVNNQTTPSFEIQFVDTLGGNVLGTIPVRFGDIPSNGAHRVSLAPGQSVDGIDFGNQVVPSSRVSGRAWVDANGNGVRDGNEQGMGGVTIYDDRNFNGVLDGGETSTVTQHDHPLTDFDEGGLYVLAGLTPGKHWIAQVEPHGFEQTFPSRPIIAIFPPPPGGGVHEVDLAPNQSLDGLDFGNRRVEFGAASGIVWHDANANAELDPHEEGMGGVPVYADRNFNGKWDFGEAMTFSFHDNPETADNEAGTYHLVTNPGFQSIRQMVPHGAIQTYPIAIAASPLEVGSHFVNIAPGETTPGLNFGNSRVRDVAPPLPGDYNHDGLVNFEDLNMWAENYGRPIVQDSLAAQGDGSAFLEWQRNAGNSVRAASVALSEAAVDAAMGTTDEPAGAALAGAATTALLATESEPTSSVRRAGAQRRSAWRGTALALDAALSAR